jgi:hypothetical protein
MDIHHSKLQPEYVTIVFSYRDDHAHRATSFEDQYDLCEEAHDWLKSIKADYDIEPLEYDGEGDCITFAMRFYNVKDFILFKTFWL